MVVFTSLGYCSIAHTCYCSIALLLLSNSFVLSTTLAPIDGSDGHVDMDGGGGSDEGDVLTEHVIDEFIGSAEEGADSDVTTPEGT